MAHWVYGSGLPGCLYDYGPHCSPTLKGAIDGLLCVFAEQLEPGEEKRLRRNLRVAGGHRFENPEAAGAAYCEVTKYQGSCPRQEED